MFSFASSPGSSFAGFVPDNQVCERRLHELIHSTCSNSSVAHQLESRLGQELVISCAQVAELESDDIDQLKLCVAARLVVKKLVRRLRNDETELTQNDVLSQEAVRALAPHSSFRKDDDCVPRFLATTPVEESDDTSIAFLLSEEEATLCVAVGELRRGGALHDSICQLTKLEHFFQLLKLSHASRAVHTLRTQGECETKLFFVDEAVLSHARLCCTSDGLTPWNWLVDLLSDIFAGTPFTLGLPPPIGARSNIPVVPNEASYDAVANAFVAGLLAVCASDPNARLRPCLEITGGNVYHYAMRLREWSKSKLVFEAEPLFTRVETAFRRLHFRCRHATRTSRNGAGVVRKLTVWLHDAGDLSDLGSQHSTHTGSNASVASFR
ncbi:MAG: hypothetical protein MHM6MM_002833 [Cercozoa sp. M6MM]